MMYQGQILDKPKKNLADRFIKIAALLCFWAVCVKLFFVVAVTSRLQRNHTGFGGL